MATVKARKRQKGTVYRAEVRVKGHPRLSQTFDRQSDAMRWAEDTEKALRDGGHVGSTPPPDDMLFDDALEKYLAETSSKKAKSTHRRELYKSRSLHFSTAIR